MVGRKDSGAQRSIKDPLSRARVVTAAIRIADGSGLSEMTMRAVAASLGVEAMSLYNHIANRSDLLDGMVDAVFASIDLPDSGDWRSDIRRVAESTRAALRAHPWASGMLDSRSRPGEATLRHHDHVLGVLRRSGFSTTLAVHVFALVDSYVYGSVVQESSLPFDESGGQQAAAKELLTDLSEQQFPNLAEIAQERSIAGSSAPGPDDEFEFGLRLILDALAPDLA